MINWSPLWFPPSTRFWFMGVLPQLPQCRADNCCCKRIIFFIIDLCVTFTADSIASRQRAGMFLQLSEIIDAALLELMKIMMAVSPFRVENHRISVFKTETNTKLLICNFNWHRFGIILLSAQVIAYYQVTLTAGAFRAPVFEDYGFVDYLSSLSLSCFSFFRKKNRRRCRRRHRQRLVATVIHLLIVEFIN